MSQTTQTSTGPSIADRTTPLLRNHWYIAARSVEIGETLLARWILERDVLLYRKADGTAVAMQNRCCHRSFPLSRGYREGDNVVCGYHGITYGPDGQCVRVPSQKGLPANVRQTSYPVVERFPFVWIWMGEAEDADAATLPDLPWIGRSDVSSVEGYFDAKCNYLPLHENVIDLTHAHYLHGEDVASLKFVEIAPEISQNGDIVRIRRVEPDTQAPSQYAKMAGTGDHRVNRISDSYWLSPAVMYAHAQIEDLSPEPGAREVFNFWIMHAFTPASAGETHYFWSNARDCSVGDTRADEIIRERSTRVYYEDVEGLQWVEEQWNRTPRHEYRETSVAADRPALLVRRIVARMAADEVGR